MTKRFKSSWLLVGLRLALGGVFLYAAWRKIQDPGEFAETVASFQLLPDQAIPLFALSLPPFEALIGGLLIVGWKKRGSTFTALLAMVIFILALGQALARGLKIDCGCFGPAEPSHLNFLISFVRDILLVAIASVLYLAELHKGDSSAEPLR